MPKQTFRLREGEPLFDLVPTVAEAPARRVVGLRRHK